MEKRDCFNNGKVSRVNAFKRSREMTPRVSSPVSSIYSWKVVRINVWFRSVLNIHYWVLWFPTASSSFLMVFNTSLWLLQEIKLWVASKANYLAWVWSRFKMKAFAASWWSQKVVAAVWFHLRRVLNIGQAPDNSLCEPNPAEHLVCL